MYFAIAFGTSMSNVDAVVFRGIKDGDNEGVYHDLHLDGYSTPTIEEHKNDFTPREETPKFEDGVYKFIVTRPFYSTRKNQIAMVCGERYLFSWVGCSTHSKINIKHTHSDRFNFVLRKDC